MMSYGFLIRNFMMSVPLSMVMRAAGMMIMIVGVSIKKWDITEKQ